MKCLSIHQPWAALVVLGAKRFETRSWQTDHRGRMAIHASRTFRDSARMLCEKEPFRSALQRGGYRQERQRGEPEIRQHCDEPWIHQVPLGSLTPRITGARCSSARPVHAVVRQLRACVNSAE